MEKKEIILEEVHFNDFSLVLSPEEGEGRGVFEHIFGKSTVRKEEFLNKKFLFSLHGFSVSFMETVSFRANFICVVCFTSLKRDPNDHTFFMCPKCRFAFQHTENKSI